MPIQRLSRTAVAHAALLALCGAAHAQAQPENVPEATLAPVTVNAGTEKENPTGPVVGFTVKRAISAQPVVKPIRVNAPNSVFALGNAFAKS